jgi:hypothetical protein
MRSPASWPKVCYFRDSTTRGEIVDNADILSGRLLDAAVAQHLFGLEVEERTNNRTQQKDVLCRAPGQQWVRCAFFAESTGASLNVEYELRQRGWTWRREERPVSRWSQPGVGRVVLDHKDGRTVEAVGTTLSEALCRAAVKAVAT